MIEYELIQQRTRELQANAERERLVRAARAGGAGRPEGLLGRVAGAVRRTAAARPQAEPRAVRPARTARAEGC
ncbi:hypothetical protein OG689_15560 [Kitasatospora sp. NBC_00240]|uniref:hypothetical protein n=1 Tax=Kitasatospora sp. NBC_00240 TaxID=2903567 RepID=UPI002255AB9D|nr:hypothetical protein [Kitasatospora sp. NBC_00240]MCX5210686.1 hypothetical protein [Kitasatospora sp. NBC_00240]